MNPRRFWAGPAALALLLAACADKAPPEEETAADAAVCRPDCAAGARRCVDDELAQVCADYDGNGCAEWGGDVICPAATTCQEGACAAECRHACAEGEAVCGGGGLRQCIPGPGGCRVLSEPMPCGENERCDDGECIPIGRPCHDACAAEGTRECAEDGYRRCGRFDEDRCLEWSVTIPCAGGEACDAGECVPACADECRGGEARCVAGGVSACGQHDDDPCLDLGAPVACGPEERCDDTRCVPADQACNDACEADGDTRCEGDDAYRRCGQYDDDDCLDLSPPVACGAGETCDGGACAADCLDACPPGEHRCEAGRVLDCGNFDADDCLEWSAPRACPDGERCDDGACVPEAVECENACAAGMRRCNAGLPETCGQHDEDDCAEWGPDDAPCGARERCEGAGECVPDCRDECADGDVQCAPGGLARCGEHDDDACLEIGPPEACPAGQSCSGDRCRAECVDDCDAGGRDCVEGGSRQCGQYDADPCRDWSSPAPCGAREACRAGACEPVCGDECEGNERLCVGGGYVVCGNHDADPCLELGGGENCGAGMCVDGACVVPCEDECPRAGAAQCGGDGGVETCGNFDADRCLEWSVAAPCQALETCRNAACVRRPPPARPIINEVLADADGRDPAGAFIEVHGPAGTELAGFTLVGVNGADGDDYARIPLEGRIGGNDLFVVAHPEAAAALRAVAQQLHVDADLQNGPDSLQLRWGDEVLDSVGYGDFAMAEFAGEGRPVALGVIGESLSRDREHTDTQVNAEDFASGDPTPGEAGDRCPRAGCGCVIPEAVGPVVAAAGLEAIDNQSRPLPCLDARPVDDGFAVAAASWNQMRFALVGLDGRVRAGPHALGNTSFNPWGTNDAYHPSIVDTGAQFAVTWSGYSNQGNRDIYLRRLTLDGQLIQVANMVVSERKGFNPFLWAGAGPLQIFYNAYWEVVRIDLNPLAEVQARQVITSRNGDTREDGYVQVAQTPEGTLGLLYVHASGDFGTPRIRFRRLSALGVPEGNEVDLGEGRTHRIRKTAYLVGLAGDRFGVVWQHQLADANNSRIVNYAVLDRDGREQSRLRVNDLDPPELYRPHLDLHAVAFDGERIGVAHRRDFPDLEPAHHAIQWFDAAGRPQGRTELGDLLGFPFRHEEDGRWWILVPGAPVRLAPLVCP